MKTFLLLLGCLVVGRVTAQERVVQSTPFTRTLLRATDAASARTILGTSAGGTNSGIPTLNGSGTNTTLYNPTLNGTPFYGALGLSIYGANGTNLNYENTTGLGRHQFFGDVYLDDDLTVNGTITGNGSGVTALNADNIASGTVPSARLPIPDTVAWAAGALTLGWPTTYHTHSITSNTWVTGFAGVTAGKTLTAFLTLTNATATDWTLSVSNSVTSVDGLRSWTVTNKQSRGFSFKVGAQTNSANGPLF